MIRSFKVENSLKSRVKVLLALSGQNLSDAEFSSLIAVISYSVNNSIFVSAHIGGIIKKEFGLSDSAFSTSLFRLEKKGLIKRDGKTIVLHPMLSNVGELEKLVVSFQ